MWPDSSVDQLQQELDWIAGDDQQVALGAFEESDLVGFVELSIHPHAVGCGKGPVAYLEAWYVRQSHRGQAVGRRLVAAGCEWARERGCRELASDTWFDNLASHEAHLALGFSEAARMIHYRRVL